MGRDEYGLRVLQNVRDCASINLLHILILSRVVPTVVIVDASVPLIYLMHNYQTSILAGIN